MFEFGAVPPLPFASWRATRQTSGGTVSELPDGPTDATGLTTRQQRILEHLRDFMERRGYPPSMREIGEAVGLTSSSSVAHQLKVLEEKGFVRRDPNRPRALEVFLPEVMAARRAVGSADESSHDETGIGDAVPAGDLRPGAGPDRRRWPDPGRGEHRGRLPAAPGSWSATASCSCSRSAASR